MIEAKIKQDPASWEAGYAAGLAGNTGAPPAGIDPLSWYTRLIEGKADQAKPPAKRHGKFRRPMNGGMPSDAKS